MKTQVTELFGMEVYTEKAIRVGIVDDAILNVDSKKIDFLAVSELNPELIQLKGFKGIKIPYRIIRSIGDIIIIRHFSNMFPAKDAD
ncbi:MAG: PRC-barrel domain-containing protein [Methanomicrobium sp.]|jgi:sporulation protein YlmC with PRC-barrel domain|uniref:PRC-barrel domain-containing protein n=1 Tax=Methanomicrobium mobile TaxID=2205 RepID=UPI0005B2C914|nr:PRC-barrel domain-containing protein [Methanomicrobium mobile]MBO7388219.1 PRC-barrel domain-containing protein [Methanomicrobium sp.]MBP5083310.1 PRC-barrel domain-containing protein [Methanomicrobium sp.]MBQ3718996.1 PRC-barrel domain-containing protein [Methanomicrobium sp.]